MTDTPRSVNDILALLDDNGINAISAQDLRDAIVSIVNPVAGGGFDRIGGGSEVAFFGFDTNYPTGVDVPNLTSTVIPLFQGSPEDIDSGFFYDPEGWFRPDDTYDSTDWFGYVLDEGTWAEVPTGIYLTGVYVAWDTNTTGYRTVFGFESADNRIADVSPRLDPFGWDPVYASPFTTGRQQAAAAMPDNGPFLTHTYMSLTRIPEATGPQPMAICGAYQNSGGTRKILGGGVNVVRLGPVD